MFSNKKIINFIQKSKKIKSDIVCINILETNSLIHSKSDRTIFVNSNGESIGITSDSAFEKFVLDCSKEILLVKKGKCVKYNDFEKLWIEPFYYDEDYGSIGVAFSNVLKGINNTLIRSIKYSGAHSFTPNFDEKDNHFNENKNLIFQKIKSPFKLLILGVGKGCESLLKVADKLGWQTCVCDTKGTSFKSIKSADDIVLLESAQNAYKVVDKYFDAAIIMSHNHENETIYLNTLIESNISYISMIGSKKRNTFYDERLHYFENFTSESKALFICTKIKSNKNDFSLLSSKDEIKEIIYEN